MKSRQFLFSLFLVTILLTPLHAETLHRLLTADSSKGRIAIIDDAGQIEWEYKIGPLHDLHYLENGNVLFQDSWTHIIEVEPKTNEFVWEYDSATAGGNQGKKVEVHAFQRLDDGQTMIVESGVSRIIEVDVHGKIVKEIPLQVSQPHPHRDTRLVRKLESGNYLVCHEGDGVVREYGRNGKTVWEYSVPLFDRKPIDGHGPEAFGNQCFAALRLNNGNTLISTGNGHSVIEVTPEKEIVWKLDQNELDGIQLGWVTTLQQLENGNLVIGNCHAGEKNPQIIEITRDKQVVWKFHDFERFGNSLTNTQILN
ncbi:MAG: PQQ-binding-like beta-propeller repeat protein [Pirellulaceae bacterium]